MSLQENKLKPYIPAAGAIALSLGTSIGWGSLVITSNTYLFQAGPAGSTIGMMIGAVIMLIIARNYYYMMNCFPEAGGAYTYARDTFGYDHGFLAAWFLVLTYFAMLWANATALPLFARYFIGDIFETGHMYSLFGYDVYLGEALLSIAAVFIIAFLSSRSKKITILILIVMTVIFAAAIIICFTAAVTGHSGSFSPYFVENKSALSQIVKIACISPWAFIGFECISHATEEFSFKRGKVFRILVASVIIITALYIFVTLLSITAYPSEYSSWYEYIADIGNLSGIKGLPAFYAASHYLGSIGTAILMAALLSLIFTSLIGNIYALSRLLYSMAKDEILPGRFARLNDKGVPGNAVMLTAVISIIIPFIGRTAIGWIVDVTTLGATIIYGIVSASALKIAKTRNDSTEKVTGMAGLIIMIGFGLYLLLPNLFTTGSMETVSYFLFVVWSVLGFIYFRVILQRDKDKRFGKSIIVWIALLSLILFVSLVWMSRSTMDITTSAMNNVSEHFNAAGMVSDESGYIAAQLEAIRRTNTRSIIVVVGIVALSLGVLLNNYSLMSRRALESELQLGRVRDMANTDPLTGVKSKHACVEKEAELDGKIANGELTELSVVVCDVNGLKHINDTLGHKAGDEYIKKAAMIICEYFKHSPVYRTGGDEFVVYMTGKDYGNRQDIIKRFRESSEEGISNNKIVISAGISDLVPGSDTNVHEIFERADKLMYEEKQRLKSLGAVTR